MKMKKILATLLATAVATTMAVSSVFAATTIELDAEYPGDWGGSASIKKADLQAIGGDVKITLDLETAGLLPTQYVFKTMDIDNGWTAIYDGSDSMTSDTLMTKPDGFAPIQEGQTSAEFVVKADKIETLGDNGLAFQVAGVWIKSATLELAEGPAAAMVEIADDLVPDYCFKKGDYAADAAPATEEAPAATENTETGNAPIVGMVAIMALAGAAMVASKKK